MKTISLSKDNRWQLLLLLFCLSFLTSLKSSGQTYTASGVFPDSGGVVSGTIYVNNVDTLNVDEVEVVIGAFENDSSCVFQVFDFDTPSGLPSGFSYSRYEDDLVIQVSSSQVLFTYYCSVRIKDLNGTWSSRFEFISN